MIMSNGIISNEQCRYALLCNAFINVNTFGSPFLIPHSSFKTPEVYCAAA